MTFRSRGGAIGALRSSSDGFGPASKSGKVSRSLVTARTGTGALTSERRLGETSIH